mgnify:CR=1 FL=1
MSDQETMMAYAKAASEYADKFADPGSENQDTDSDAFLNNIPAGGRILDLGCGPGHWAAKLRDAGLTVDAMDASPEMAQLAKSRFGLDVQVGAFDDLNAENHYDGIWANFSLLHVPRADFPNHLVRIHHALRPGGSLSIGMKIGSGERRDHLGRFYSYYGEQELRDLLTKAGFTVTRARQGNGKGLAGSVETFVVMTAHG